MLLDIDEDLLYDIYSILDTCSDPDPFDNGTKESINYLDARSAYKRLEKAEKDYYRRMEKDKHAD